MGADGQALSLRRTGAAAGIACGSFSAAATARCDGCLYYRALIPGRRPPAPREALPALCTRRGRDGGGIAAVRRSHTMAHADDTAATAAARAKRAARERALAARDALAPAERARLSALVCARAADASRAARRAASLMLFASFRSEVDTGAAGRARVSGAGSRSRCRASSARASSRRCCITDPATDLAPGTLGHPRAARRPARRRPRRARRRRRPGRRLLRRRRPLRLRRRLLRRLPAAAHARARRASRSPSRSRCSTSVPCEAHDLTVDAIVTESRVIRPA